jgi:hypothetical protein
LLTIKQLKWKLKKLGVDPESITSLFSVEKPVCNLLPLTEEQKAAPQDFGAVDYMRVRVIPVLGTSPSIFGQAMASFALCALAGQPYAPEGVERMSKNLKHKVKQVSKKNEAARFGSERAFDLDDDDVEWVCQQVWRSRCAVTGRRFGGQLTMCLTRWDAEQPPCASNLVLMLQEQAVRLAALGHAAFDADTQAKISQRLCWARTVCDESWETPDGHTVASAASDKEVRQRIQRYIDKNYRR